MTRTNAREIAVHLVYSLHYFDEAADTLLEQLFEPEYYAGLGEASETYAEVPDEAQKTYISTILRGVQEHLPELDDYIRRYAVGWSLERISKISRAIMETAMFEALYVDDVPMAAAINEAVELCKKYGDPETAAFVNGILGSFAKEVASHDGAGI